jgi:hypothetical protein
MMVYILHKIEYNKDDYLIEVIGVYSSEELAESKVDELQETETLSYFIQEIEMDAPPILTEEEVEDALQGLMDMGVVDQLIGEDGNFYYTIIEDNETYHE